MRPEFTPLLLNEVGKSKRERIRQAFSALLDEIEDVLDHVSSREKSLVVTKLQEASTWALRAMALAYGNQKLVPAPAVQEPFGWACAHCGRARPEHACGTPCPTKGCGSGVLRQQVPTTFKPPMMIASINTLNGFVSWPDDKPVQYNGSGSPCDMWTGPCQCGATHKDGR